MMMQPPVEDLLDVTGGRFELVVLGSRRARQINAYFNQLGEGIGHYVPPQVHTLSHKALTIAFEEISDGKLVVDPSED
jgi:DNA-directed RNA polymerase subunit omega